MSDQTKQLMDWLGLDEQVVAYMTRRNESEIVAFPEHVAITGRGDIPR